jgi:hypothetical protein
MDGVPLLEVHSFRPARRIGPDGQTVTELVIEMTQRRRGYRDLEMQRKVEEGEIEPIEPDFILRGGCTLLVDPSTARVRYCIYKDVSSANRLSRMRDHLLGGAGGTLRETYLQVARHGREGGGRGHGREPLALLHRSTEIEEGEEEI